MENEMETRYVEDRLLHLYGMPVSVTGRVTTHPENWKIIDEPRQYEAQVEDNSP